MNATRGFNEKVARMVRVIDEDAFRKDLLALNAAVEAAHAASGAPAAKHPPAQGSSLGIARATEPAAEMDGSEGLAALAKSLRVTDTAIVRTCNS